MAESIIPSNTRPGLRIAPSGLIGMFERMARSALISRLANIACGHITLIEQGEPILLGDQTCSIPRATIEVHDPSFYTDVAFGGSIGAGESYMAGAWSTNDLTALIRIILLNQDVVQNMEGGFARITAPLHWLLHTLRKNTKEGSRKNITAHYDLGNDFYSLWLDPTMTYSCNIFEHNDTTLEQAAIAKYDRICRKLDLKPQDHVLEIGTGWGGFALHAAKQYGCRVTTTTISQQQFDFAKQRIQQAGLTARIELLFKDYRDLTEQYDKLVSIEMIEAVGHHFIDTYFKACSDRLKDNGMMALQAITIKDQVYDAHIRSADFIKRYIFPGSFIPSITAITHAIAKATDMKLFHLEDITPHYARTLRTWRERFFARIEDVRRLGYPESFIRMWEYYLCYCEAGFMERYLGDAQMIFTKPGCRQNPFLPQLQAAGAAAGQYTGSASTNA
jgi:cyclopropane-fatty-acyl-phospholipid synthase